MYVYIYKTHNINTELPQTRMESTRMETQIRYFKELKQAQENKMCVINQTAYPGFC